MKGNVLWQMPYARLKRRAMARHTRDAFPRAMTRHTRGVARQSRAFLWVKHDDFAQCLPHFVNHKPLDDANWRKRLRDLGFDIGRE